MRMGEHLPCFLPIWRPEENYKSNYVGFGVNEFDETRVESITKNYPGRKVFDNFKSY